LLFDTVNTLIVMNHGVSLKSLAVFSVFQPFLKQGQFAYCSRNVGKVDTRDIRPQCISYRTADDFPQNTSVLQITG